jgi:hypothetical protein
MTKKMQKMQNTKMKMQYAEYALPTLLMNTLAATVTVIIWNSVHLVNGSKRWYVLV